jgi:WD40 repeat protein
VSSSANRICLFAWHPQAAVEAERRRTEHDGEALWTLSAASVAPTSSQVLSMLWLPTRSVLVTGSVLGDVGLWRVFIDREAGTVALTPWLTVSAHAGPVGELAALPDRDNAIVSSGLSDGKIALVQVHDGVTSRTALLRSTLAHRSGVLSMVYDETTHRIVTAGNDTVPVMHRASLIGAEALPLSGDSPHEYYVCCVRAVPRAAQVVTLDVKGTLKVWDSRSRRCLQTVQPRSTSRVLRLAKWSHILVVHGGDLIATCSDMSTWFLSGAFKVDLSIRKQCDATPVEHICVSMNGVAAEREGQYHGARRRSTSRRPSVSTLTVPHSKLPATLGISTDSSAPVSTRPVIITGASLNMRVWNSVTGDMTSTFNSAAASRITAMDIDQEHAVAFFGQDSGTITSHSYATGLLKGRFRVHAAPVVALLFVASRESGCTGLMSCARDGTVVLTILQGHEHAVSESGSDGDEAAALGSVAPVQHVMCTDVVARSIARLPLMEDSVAVLAVDGEVVVFDNAFSSDEAMTICWRFHTLPALRSGLAPSSFVFVRDSTLCVVADGCDLSVVRVMATKVQRLASWSTHSGGTPLQLWFSPQQQLVAVHEAPKHMVVYSVRALLSEAELCIATGGFMDPALHTPPPLAAFQPFAADIRTAHFCPEWLALVVTSTANEAALHALDGTFLGRLDAANSSNAEWLLPTQADAASTSIGTAQPMKWLSTSGEALAKVDLGDAPTLAKKVAPKAFRKMQHEGVAHSPVRRARPRRRGDGILAVEASPEQRHGAGKTAASVKASAQRETSQRTQLAFETRADLWSVDYPDELAEAVRRDQRNGDVLSLLPNLKVTIRRLQPSQRTVDDDTRARDLTHRILHPNGDAAGGTSPRALSPETRIRRRLEPLGVPSPLPRKAATPDPTPPPIRASNAYVPPYIVPRSTRNKPFANAPLAPLEGQQRPATDQPASLGSFLRGVPRDSDE